MIGEYENKNVSGQAPPEDLSTWEPCLTWPQLTLPRLARFGESRST